jgi:RecA-family ATPase
VAALIRERFPAIDWHQLWATEDEGEEWIIEPLLPARRLVALFSAPKAGKSLLMLEMAVGVAAGTEVLGRIPDRPRRVLYVDFENDPRGDIRQRLRAMGKTPADLENLVYLSYPTMAKLDTAAGAYELLAICAEYGCEVVIIDTISRAVGGEENVNDTWLAFYRHCGLALKQAGISCIRLDHTGKDADKGMRGGSAKYGDVDAVWRLTATGGASETVTLHCTDKRMVIDETELVLTRRTFPLRHEVSQQGRKAADALRASKLKLALIEHCSHLPVADDARGNGRDHLQGILKAAGVPGITDTTAMADAIRMWKKGREFAAKAGQE